MYPCPSVEAPKTECTHEGVRIRENTEPPRPRVLYRFEGNTPNVDFRVHSNSLNNGMKAVMERVFYVKHEGLYIAPPAPIKEFRARLAAFRTAVCRDIGTIPPLTYQEFVGHYKGRRRLLYSAAADYASVHSFTTREAILSSFIKTERFDYGGKPDAVPRLIQPRGSRFNVRLGRYTRPIEHALYESIDRVFRNQTNRVAGTFAGRTVMKGLNATEVAKEIRFAWKQFRKPIAFFFDVSRFDQHVSVAALKYEHSVYENAVPRGELFELQQLLRAQLTNKGFVRCTGDDKNPGGTIRYVRKGMRASGDMNTASGNVLLMCALMHSFMQGKCRYRLIDNGDDCVLIGEQSKLPAAVVGIQAWFREMGFTLKIDGDTTVCERIRFCQTSPVKTAKGWVMVRAPETMAKDLATTRDMRRKVFRDAWLVAIGDCGRALSDGVPVTSAFYATLPQPKVKQRVFDSLPIDAGIFHLAKGMSDAATPISVKARLSYELAFGIRPWEQMALERSFTPLSTTTLVVPYYNLAYCGLAGTS
jgi:hypothetical protein